MTKESTKSVHEAEPFDEETGSLVSPIYQTSTFAFTKAAEVAPAVKGKSGAYVYSRWDNPTVVRLEKKLAAFESGEDAAFFSSGMAAISTALFAFVRKGTHVVSTRDLYGGTYNLIHDVLPGLGLDTTMVDTVNLAEMDKAMRKNTRIVYIETPSNPTLKLVDIKKAVEIAHGNGALLFVDSTFASPINQNPISLGADVVLHSATKYLNGHADVTAGAAVANKENTKKIKMMRRDLGGTLDPHAAWLILRRMKTMALRISQQNKNAQILAEYLVKHRKVKCVNYPGLKTHPQHALAKRQMRGFGGMMSFELRGTLEETMKLTESLKVGSLAASLGGVATLVSQPAAMTHTQLSPEERARTGIPDTLVRLSVGIEDPDDLVNDFEQALAKI